VSSSGRTPRTLTLPSFTLESGVTLQAVRQAYHLEGTINAAGDNLIVVLHALTGSADAAEGWWRGLIGPGLALDTERYAVLSPNLLGSCYGSTGPNDFPDGAFPAVTPRDQARLVARLVEHLGVRDVALTCGGSLGGMVALEFGLSFAGRIRATVVLAAPAAHTAHAIAWNAVQRACLDLGGARGLELARQVAMISFRTEREFEARFGRATQPDGRFAMETYLEHHGRKLAARFDAATYRTLTRAMDAHDVGRGRGGVGPALRAIPGALFAVGVPGDQLYSADVVREWAVQANAEYRELESHHGHDAFLLEIDQVGAILREAIAAGQAMASIPGEPLAAQA
jgi:homoserine O-acetyltransferase